MPCMKCANGKWKYGEHGNCQFDTLAACKKAAAAIHIQESDMTPKTPAKKPKKPAGAIDIQPAGPHVPAMPATYSIQENDMTPVQPVQPTSPWHDPTCQCAMCKAYRPM